MNFNDIFIDINTILEKSTNAYEDIVHYFCLLDKDNQRMRQIVKDICGFYNWFLSIKSSEKIFKENVSLLDRYTITNINLQYGELYRYYKNIITKHIKNVLT